MSTKNDAHLTLWDSWLRLKESTGSAVEQRAYEIFTQIKQAACEELKRSAARFARLGTKDENIYQCLTKLMEVYQRVVELGEEIEQDESTVGALMSGLCEVLSSRLKEFDEVSLPDLLVFDGEDSENVELRNPITMEKQAITDRALLHFYGQLECTEKAFIPQLQANHPQVWAELCNGVLNPPGQVLLESIITDEYLPAAYVYFQDALRLCLAKLDDLHGRKVTGFYTEFIEREWEELGNIIKVQILALESAATEADAAGYDEFLMVYRILNVLREAYQYTGPVIDELQKLLQSPPVRHSGLTYEEFTASVSSALTADGQQGLPEAILNSEFFTLLSGEATALPDELQVEFSEAAGKARNMIDLDKQLAEKIVQVFENLQKTLPSLSIENAPVAAADEEAQDIETAENTEPEGETEPLSCDESQLVPEDLPCDETEYVPDTFPAEESDIPVDLPHETLPPNDTAPEVAPATLSAEDAQLQLNILKGISETIEIKVDSLRDSIQLFEEDGQNLLRGISEEKVTVPADEMKRIQDVVRESWLASPPGPDSIAEFFSHFLNSDIFAPVQDRVKKRAATNMDRAEKFAFRFKKEVILYEVCTYEEILTHSASRLRESVWTDMTAAENQLTAAYGSLESLLEANGIFPIRPAAHEQFNAFEHEILVAESQEGFAKGEIIKIINTGYKQSDKVILRANVIAAR